MKARQHREQIENFMNLLAVRSEARCSERVSVSCFTRDTRNEVSGKSNRTVNVGRRDPRHWRIGNIMAQLLFVYES